MLDNNLTFDWLRGIPYEVAFWNNVYRWKHTFEGLINWSNYNKVINLEGYDANTWLCSLGAPIVFDVGCGMSYATGNFITTDSAKTPLDIHYIDPLADYYNAILHRYNRSLPYIEFGMGEYLSAFATPNSVDMVIIQNALDHSANPLKSIVESLEVLKVGGVLYLNHHINEAEMEKYKGFHKYNICDDGGGLFIWNKKQRWNVAEEFNGFTEIEKVERMENGHVVAIIRKIGDVPAELLTDKKDKRELCSMLLQQFQQDYGLCRVINLRLTYWKYNVIQFFAQCLPWAWKMKLKHLIKQA